MKRLYDYDEFSQAIPRYKPLSDMGTGRTHIIGAKYAKLEDFLAMQQTLQDKINEQTSLLEHILKVLQILTLLVTGANANDEDED